MAFHDKKWYLTAIERANKMVQQHQADLNRLIASADHSLAAMKCEDLKNALLRLNSLENQLADLD